MRAAVPRLLGKTTDAVPVWDGLSRWQISPHAVDQEAVKALGLSQRTCPAGVVRFRYTGAADTVAVAGVFTGWNPAKPEFRMTRQLDGTFELSVPLPPGQHAYKYIVNGQWTEPRDILSKIEPEPTTLVNNGFGGHNAVIELTVPPARQKSRKAAWWR